MENKLKLTAEDIEQIMRKASTKTKISELDAAIEGKRLELLGYARDPEGSVIYAGELQVRQLRGAI